MSISRRHFLGSCAGAGALSMLSLPAYASGGKRIIVIRAFGGWDTTFCLDPRLTSYSDSGTKLNDGPDFDESGQGLDVESIENYSGIPIATNVSKRPSVDAFFSQFGSQAIAVNGIYMGSIVHDECRKRIMTGTRSSSNADFGMLSALKGADAHAIPYMILTGGAYVGEHAALSGQVGLNNQIKALLDRTEILPGPIGSGTSYPLFDANPDQQALIDGFTQSRLAKMQAAGWDDPRSVSQLDGLVVAQDRLAQLLDQGSLIADNIEFGSSNTLEAQAELAAYLMSEGLCHGAALSTENSWDTHSDLGSQHALYEGLFNGLHTLGQQLISLDLLDETIVVVVSEMSRTPIMNSDNGKDHWSYTSALLFGGGINGGRVLGGTDETMAGHGINLNDGSVDPNGAALQYDQFVAGLLHAAGDDAETLLPNSEVLHGIVD